MGPTRFPYGVGVGFDNNFAYRGTTANLITQSDATPDVTVGSLFYTNNTDNTTITHFDLQDYANRAASYEGKIITVFFLDNSTRLANAGRLFLAGTNDLLSRDATSIHGLTLMFSRSGWYELQRHIPNRNEVLTLAINANSSADVNDVRLLILNNTGGTTTALIALSGGQVGQIVSVISQGSNANVIKGGGNIYMVVTDGVAVNASGVYQIQKVSATSWRMLGVGSGAALG